MKIAQLKKKDDSTCSYEEWSKDNKAMVACGCKAIVKAGKGFLCEDHLSFFISSRSDYTLYTADGKQFCKGSKKFIERLTERSGQ